MSKEISVTIYRELPDGSEMDIEVTADCSPGCDAVPYLRNGDPGYPAEPPEIQITSAVGPTGDDVELTEEEKDAAIEKIMEASEDE